MDTLEECQKKEYPEEFGNGVHLGGGRGKPRNIWMQEIMTGMKAEKEDWNEWRRKIELEARHGKMCKHFNSAYK